MTPTSAVRQEIKRLVRGEHHDPHHVLGAHPGGGRVTVRALRPDATAMTVLLGDDKVPMARVHQDGVFEGSFTGDRVPDYRLEVVYGEQTLVVEDPYRFLPTVSDDDLRRFAEGRHERLWEALGAHPRVLDGVPGTAFAVWAPNARAVRVVGDFNIWDGRINPMRSLGSSGVWELFVPGVGQGARYKYEVVGADGKLVLKADPYALAAEVPPANASVVHASDYAWGDDAWLAKRAATELWRSPVSIYEVHLGSWRQGLDYRQLADQLADYVSEMGFTHVELMPVMEHPYAPSWGYQVTSYYAPTSRFGDPDDFRYFVDHLHRRGIGVIADWVPAHFPKDEWALGRFDGSALYEHEGARGEHPDWGSYVFNVGRNEVRNFLVANALYWLEEFHLDGLRIDAVASMLYLDYSRKAGEWSPNRFGGNEDLESVEFFQQVNRLSYARNPGIVTIAEESTAWDGVTRPVDRGGLGFGFKWNMGWMHDSLEYVSKEPIHRQYHHNELTFSLVYAFSENYVLPISHDEVVHGKRSLLGRMPGDDWQRLANLRAYLAFMWSHPGKQLLFMGSELGQDWEWSEQSSIDWEALSYEPKRQVQDLVRELNRVYRATPALFERDNEPAGFAWLAVHEAQDNLIAFVRLPARDADADPGRGGDATTTRAERDTGGGADPLVCLCNFSPVPRTRRTGLPEVPGGSWEELLNTDDARYGGSGVGTPSPVVAERVPWDGQPTSAELTFPPLATVWLRPRRR
jgi:1,4-alpha-glucan branching enzyme